jgi:arginase
VCEVCGAVAATIHTGCWPLVTGGDCTITIGVLSGLRQADAADIALLYFDGGPDLRMPADQPDCCLDAMGVAHILGLDGASRNCARSRPFSAPEISSFSAARLI